ncbi:MAG: glucose-1-phosphate adenylyltransferase, partial [Novosphingobium sp.]|nr:glucose-1-phosphate adenylyltransferase [Novosphingobium sp.]
YELMLQQHVDSGADVTVGCLEVPRKQASGFGVMHVDKTDRIISFLEKPADPPGMPDKPDMALASMGIYVFETNLLFDQLRRDDADPKSTHDFGNDIIPYLVANGRAFAHRFASSCVRADIETEAYWRDVGTLDAYFEANLDLTDVVPKLDMYDREWPIWTDAIVSAPAKFVHDEDGRRGSAVSSLISNDCIVSGATAYRSLLFTGVKMGSYSAAEEAVILPYCNIGRHARLKRVVVDSGVRIPEGLVVGEDPELDASRFRRTDKGVCLINKAMIETLKSEK